MALFVYAVTLLGAVWLSKIGTYPTPVYVGIAVAPSFPVIAMIWAMGRLLIEEKDEYLRSRHIHHALVATGVTPDACDRLGLPRAVQRRAARRRLLGLPGLGDGRSGISQCWSAVRS